MKKIYNIILFSILCLSIFMAGCKEEEVINVEVSNVEVSSAFPLDDVTITGENFNLVQFVFVGTRQATFQLEGNTLTFQVPQSVSAGMNTVTLAMAGTQRVQFELEVMFRPIPVINTISPSAANTGEQVTITGVSLASVETVTVGGVSAEIVSADAEELVFTIPAGLPSNLPAVINLVSSGGEASSESIFYVGENLIANSTFEQGDGDDFTNWGKFNGADLLTATTAEGEAYAGRSLKAEAFGGDAWRTQFVSDAATTQVGVEYILYMWIKAESATGSMRFSTTPSAQYSGDYEISTEWQQIEWVFTANEPATQIALDMGLIEGAVYYVDNVTLIETGAAEPQPTDIILNGGFELGDGDEFTNWNKFNGNDLLTATTADGEVRSGSRALRAVGFGQDPWRTQFASDAMETIVGVEYTATIWIKGEDGSPGVGGSIRMSTQGNGDAQYQGDVSVTDEWQEVAWTFTANGTETVLVLDLGATLDAVYFIDDISLLEPPQ